MAEVVFVNNLLTNNQLIIPPYQRPYKWTKKNIEELLTDMSTALSDKQKIAKEFFNRIGTIIIHEDEKGKWNIVDGQQRLISITLLKRYLDSSFSNTILETEFHDKETQKNIHNNFIFIKQWFSLKDKSFEKELNEALTKVFQFVLIKVTKQSEAFQLFDSQNNRGKSLDPHDLLKAYHLREMRSDKYSMIHAVKKWEEKDSKEINNLFDWYLFPILNWSNKEKTNEFTVDEIDVYKGVQESSMYSYAKRIISCNSHFQIPDFFVAGNDFFEFVNYYILLTIDVVREIVSNPQFEEIKDILEIESEPENFLEVLELNKINPSISYARTLFFNVLLSYYDKFHNFDVMAIKKLFLWAMMIRVDMEKLGYDTINNYSIGDENKLYTNHFPMFFLIKKARKHTEISNLKITTERETKSARVKNWNSLYKKLNLMNGNDNEQ